MHRALGILNYVIGDYPLSVDASGKIVNRAEYDEQLALLEKVRAILIESEHADMPPSGASQELLRDLDELRRLVGQHRESPLVLDAARRLRDALVRTYDLQLWPPDLPSLARGRELYARACAVCHGTVGRARTPVAERLDPRPTNLLSRHLDETLSPYQTFNIVTYGVAGTAMPSFAPLSASERWEVAFYVTAMRQRAVPRRSSPAVNPPLQVLARSTDAELNKWLAEQGVPYDRRASEVARLRRAQVRPAAD
jgi:high-affinity iron transporter